MFNVAYNTIPRTVFSCVASRSDVVNYIASCIATKRQVTEFTSSLNKQLHCKGLEQEEWKKDLKWVKNVYLYKQQNIHGQMNL